jgi:hypothetical protein
MLAFVPYVPPRPPSPRAEALGQRLAETIEQFRMQHPDLDRDDVVQATRLAVASAGGGPAVARGVAIALVAGVAVAGLLAALAAGRDGGGDLSRVLVVAVAIMAVAVVLVLKRR